MTRRRAAGPAGEAGAVDPALVVEIVRAHAAQGGIDKNEIAKALALAPEQKQELRQVLARLVDQGALERRGRRGYAPAGLAPRVAVIVVVDRDRDGELMARLASAHADAPADIAVHPKDARGGPDGPALGLGDRALARLKADGEGRLEARIIKRLGRGEGRRILGLYRVGHGGPRIAPVDRGRKDDFHVRPGDPHAAEDGDLVLVALERDHRRPGRQLARIVETVGRGDSPKAATLIALAEHDIPVGFSEEEEAEAARAAPVGLKGREDLTGVPLLTIDPEDARDHDDAVWAAPDDDPKNPGGHVVLVAIADVAAYVRPGSALDRGAEMRGNSVYFPDRVAPMLPERLSADLCSLRAGEARPCLAVRLVFDKRGDKRSHRFVRGMMRSAAKLTYEQAQAAIDGRHDDATGPLLAAVLRPLWAAYAALSEARARRDPLAIEAPERRVRLGPDGAVASITRRIRLDAHRLIEEMMIQANVAAAETLEKARTPLIYRVHDEPAPEKLDALADFLPQIGMAWAKGEPATTARFNRLLTKGADGENAEILNEMVLRTQSQAIYSPDNIGHFGLNLQRYAHFTSPIRRYADLVVHRALIRALGLGEDGLADRDMDRLQTIAERISAAERRAMAAERDATDRYLAGYLAARVGAKFEGRITGVTRFGAFVRLDETGADGLVPVSRMGLERFLFDARAHALIGEETGARYRLGMKAVVTLIEATPLTGGLLFDLDTPPEPGPRPKAGRRGARPLIARRSRPRRGPRQ